MVSPTTPNTSSRRPRTSGPGGMIAVAISGAVTTAFLALCAITLVVDAPAHATHAQPGAITTQAATIPDNAP